MTPETAKNVLELWFTDDEVPPAGDYDPRVVYDALHTIAGLTPVYSYDVWCGDHWSPMDHEFDSLRSARDWLSTRERRAEARIITRMVTEWEVAE